MSKRLMSGNEAIARGAFEAGVKVASAYPGTPSTEILENLVRYPDVDASWAPNEKVALEVGIGASFGGVRSLVAMKHVGVNVAADPLFTLSYIGVRGGLVLACADDPEMLSSTSNCAAVAECVGNSANSKRSRCTMLDDVRNILLAGVGARASAHRQHGAARGPVGGPGHCPGNLA